jgi:hypothetical protein
MFLILLLFRLYDIMLLRLIDRRKICSLVGMVGIIIRPNQASSRNFKVGKKYRIVLMKNMRKLPKLGRRYLDNMINLISKLRQACHDERSKNREATEVQLYALQLCAVVEKYILPLIKSKVWLKDIFIDPEPMKDESHSIARY